MYKAVLQMREMCLHSENNDRSFCSQSPLRSATVRNVVLCTTKITIGWEGNDKSVMGSEISEKAGGTCRDNHKRINDTSEYVSSTQYV